MGLIQAVTDHIFNSFQNNEIETSLIVTIILVILNHINRRMKSHILVIHCNSVDQEPELIGIIKNNTSKYRIKSRNYTEKGMDYVFEIIVKQADLLAGCLEKNAAIENFSLMEYDSDDIL